jgi:D-aminopeptidase
MTARIAMLILLMNAPALALASPFPADGPLAKAPGLGIHIGTLAPGRYDAITDVDGVRVGHVTHIQGDGKLVPGTGPIRTGVTAIIPRTDVWHKKVFAAAWPLNGNGEMTGTIWVNESGFLEVPILLTDTLSVGRVDDGVVSWMMQRYPQIGIEDDVPLPVVAECDDGYLNDMQGRHNSAEDAVAALEAAAGGPVPQGSLGAGTGMASYGFKGGIGTASRVLSSKDGGYTVGVLVNANNGSDRRAPLVIDGVPVGQAFGSEVSLAPLRTHSIIVVVATDAPLLPDQLHRVAQRTALGLARTGTSALDQSGDLVIAFSTANIVPHYPDQRTFKATVLDHSYINPVFRATVEATEEAVINALLAAKSMTGRDGHSVSALPHDRLLQILHKYGR